MTTTPTPDRALSTSPDIDTIKARMKVTWMAGDYGAFATYMEPGALEILAGWCIPPGSTLLDVACGAGQLTIPAARAGVRATGVDIATNSLGQARARAAAEGLNVSFDEGDAEALPYPDASFDTVVCTFGLCAVPDDRGAVDGQVAPDTGNAIAVDQHVVDAVDPVGGIDHSPAFKQLLHVPLRPRGDRAPPSAPRRHWRPGRE